MPIGVYPHRSRPVAERFWSKVVKTDDGCWGWNGATTPFGYGRMTAGSRGAGLLRAHRVSWELHYGPIPAGLLVLHHCDNPPCVRPNHLFLGTMLDNSRDAVAKGRVNTAPARAERARRRAAAR